MSYNAWPSQPDRAINVNAGPSQLPYPVLLQAQSEMLDYKGTGMSIIEMSHRSKVFMEVYKKSIADLKTVLSIPDDYSVLYFQGGATGQFASIPLNLAHYPHTSEGKASANYIVSGVWSKKAAEEASKYVNVNIVATNLDTKHTTLPVPVENIPTDAVYTYVCANETVHGVELEDEYIKKVAGNSLVIGDFSSNFCSKPINISLYDVIYAGAQKNVGPAGVTIVIVKKSLLKPEYIHADCPTVLNWSIADKNDSMYNTPPCFNIYMCGLVFEWIIKAGGVNALAQNNSAKAALLYKTLEDSRLFNVPVAPEVRSRMNVVFTAKNEEIEKKFLACCSENNIVGIAGHRMVGGFRASLYNAVSLEQTQQIVDVIKKFESENQL